MSIFVGIRFKIKVSISQWFRIQEGPLTQSVLGGIGNIAFPSRSNIGKLKSPEITHKWRPEGYRIWHLTCDTGLVTCDMWHLTHGGGWTFSNIFSFSALTVWERECREDSEQKNHWISPWINYKGVYSTAPATPSLLITCYLPLTSWRVAGL